MSFRPQFHLTPPLGRLNDPNGLFIVDDTLHVFYQHDPGFPDSPKRTGWAHATTSLLRPQQWRHYPNALYPDRSYDRDGCYSGGAVVDGEEVWLFYTGNLKQQGRRIPSQNRVAVAHPQGAEGGFYRKDPGNPLIPDSEPGFTGHFRDPHITGESGGWRMVLGAQTSSEQGAVALYRSPDLQNWHFEGPIEFDISTASPGASPDILPGGYMWECPNLISLRDSHTGQLRDILVLCPQGLAPVHREGFTHYASSDQCGYLVGALEGNVFRVERGFSELDYGFEFYAPQLLVRNEQEALLLGWVGLPGADDAPSLAEGWIHSLTLPRRVSLHDGRLVQKPLWEEIPEQPPRPGFGSTRVLRSNREGVYQLIGSDAEIAFEVEISGGEMALRRGDQQRVVACPEGEFTLIADGSVVEVYAAGGRITASQAVFGARDCQWREWQEER